MKIEQVVLRIVILRLKEPFETSFGSIDQRPVIIVQLNSGGVSGYGECSVFDFPGYTSETINTAFHILSEFIVPAVLGRQFESVSTFVDAYKAIKGNRMAKAGMEMAAWDLAGKIRGLPLSKMLGGTRNRIPVGVAVGMQKTTDDLLKAVACRVEEGYSKIKIKIAPGRDIEPAKAVRTAWPSLPLQVDANGAYTRGDMRLLEELDSLGLLVIEQPFDEDDIESHVLLQKRIATPVCLDESVQSFALAQRAYNMGACRALSVKGALVGGLREAVRIHSFSVEAQLPLICGGMLSTNVGRAADCALASLPGFTLPGDISASGRYFEKDIAGPSLELGGESMIDVPAGPGLGMEIDSKSLDRFTVRNLVLRL
jgi:O-succinylbenzoate synthase